MIPCLAYLGGNCHDAVMLVEDFAITAKLPGGCDGTKAKSMCFKHFLMITKMTLTEVDGNHQWW